MRLDDEQSILYTRGRVDFFRTYPGLYVPNPLVLHAQRRNLLLKETLALTKTNWNGTQFDGALPITLKAARRVGDVLKYVSDGTTPDPPVSPLHVSFDRGTTRGRRRRSRPAGGHIRKCHWPRASIIKLAGSTNPRCTDVG
jgi:hypothetical protein